MMMVVLLGYVCHDVVVLQSVLHAVHGNKSLYMDVLFQNIPGTCGFGNSIFSVSNRKMQLNPFR